MAEAGLRELQKTRTPWSHSGHRRPLFAERGYERVAPSDIALEAEVAEQTVYNDFPTREQLVIDRDQQVQGRLCDLVRSRPAGTTPAAAVRDFVMAGLPVASLGLAASSAQPAAYPSGAANDHANVKAVVLRVRDRVRCPPRPRRKRHSATYVS